MSFPCYYLESKNICCTQPGGVYSLSAAGCSAHYGMQNNSSRSRWEELLPLLFLTALKIAAASCASPGEAFPPTHCSLVHTSVATHVRLVKAFWNEDPPWSPSGKLQCPQGVCVEGHLSSSLLSNRHEGKSPTTPPGCLGLLSARLLSPDQRCTFKKLILRLKMKIQCTWNERDRNQHAVYPKHS